MDNISYLIPKEIRAYIENNGFEVKKDKSGTWYVCGEESGEPFEMGLNLFISLYQADN